MGYSLSKWIIKIKDIIKINNCNSIIDFGCGKGFLYKNKFQIGEVEYNNLSEFWQIQNIHLYDPGVEEYSIYPNKKYDGVICTDVIEHIPEVDVIEFIDELLQKANANDQIKLGVMSTLLDDLKTKDELIKKGKKLN